MNARRKPWIDEQGQILKKNELEAISQKWSAKEWENFLSSTVDKPLQESLTETLTIENVKSELKEMYQNMLSQDEYPHLKEIVGSLLKKLTCREQQVIYQIFWEGHSQHEVAKSLGLKRSVIRNYRDQALRKLGVLFMSNILFIKRNTGLLKSACPYDSTQNSIDRRKAS